MIQVANRELCRILFDLSRWGFSYPEVEVAYCYYDGELDNTKDYDWQADNRKNIPAYDLSYLLRKFIGKGGIEIRYGDKGCIATSQIWSASADTPEDAVVSLAIDMFKQGIFIG